MFPMIDELAKQNPKMWNVCYPRIYHEPRGCAYPSPKLVSYQLLVIAMKIERGHRGQAELYELQIASHLAKFRVPIFFIAPKLMEAITNTATPQDVPWLTMKLPYESLVFMLPKGSLIHAEEGEVLFIGYARFEVEGKYKSVLNDWDYGVVNGGWILFALTAQGLFHHWNMPADSLGERLCLTDIEEFTHLLTPHNSSTGFGAHDITQEDNAIMVRVAHYLFSALLIMTDRPDMVEMGAMEKRVQKAGEFPKEFWSPNVVGGKYAIKRADAHTIPGSHHQSPRMHFVRGFWRQQVHGQGRLLRRTQWIEPYIRGVTEA